MTSFDERGQGFEKKFVMDEEKMFKATARRNRLFGTWAAQLLGYSGDKANAYIKEVIASDFAEAGDEDILRKVQNDLKQANVVVVDKDLRIKLEECQQEAIKYLEQNS